MRTFIFFSPPFSRHRVVDNLYDTLPPQGLRYRSERRYMQVTNAPNVQPLYRFEFFLLLIYSTLIFYKKKIPTFQIIKNVETVRGTNVINNNNVRVKLKIDFYKSFCLMEKLYENRVNFDIV